MEIGFTLLKFCWWRDIRRLKVRSLGLLLMPEKNTLVTSATSLKPKQFEVTSTWSSSRCLPAEVQRFKRKQTSFKPGRHALQIFHHRSTRVIAVLCTFDPPGKRCCDQTISFLMTSPTNTIRTNGGCWVLHTQHSGCWADVGCFAKFHRRYWGNFCF